MSKKTEKRLHLERTTQGSGKPLGQIATCEQNTTTEKANLFSKQFSHNCIIGKNSRRKINRFFAPLPVLA